MDELNSGLKYQKALENYESGNIKGALVDINNVIQSVPDNSEYYNYRAFLHSKLNNFNDAIEDIKKSLKLNPN